MSLTHGFASFRPNFRFNATSTNGAGSLAIFEEEHLGAAPLRGRAARVRDSRHHDAFAARVCFVNESIKIVLRDG